MRSSPQQRHLEYDSIEIPRRELVFAGPGPGFSLLLKRNCSISPGSLIRVFVLLACLAFGIATSFALRGAWLIFPFAGLEIIALGAAFLLNGRHATDCEHIELTNERLLVEQTEAERTARFECDPRTARVRLERRGLDARVLLCAPGKEMEVGRFLDALTRVEFAAELAKRLRI